MASIPGGVQDVEGFQNSTEFEELARFAVGEHNKKANALLEFVRVVNVKQQVVSGTMYYLTLEAMDGTKKNLYEAKVWVKPWMNFKELQEFKQLSEVPPSGLETPQGAPAMANSLGGIQDADGSQNSTAIDELGRFAVEEHNKKANTLLEYVQVVKVKEQVVAGTIYYLTIEAIDGGEKKLYEAKVWVKPWMNFKELQEFNPLGQQDGHDSGWLVVPTHDPIIQDAAIHAVESIQQRSNSLLPYILTEVLSARAKMTENCAKFDLLLKVKRGSREEKFMVEVDKNKDSAFHLSQMRQQDSDSGS